MQLQARFSDGSSGSQLVTIKAFLHFIEDTFNTSLFGHSKFKTPSVASLDLGICNSI